MKELLYLKDEQIKDFIQLLFYAYRETFSDPKLVLEKYYAFFVGISCFLMRFNWNDHHFRGEPLNLLHSGNGQHIGAVIQDHIGSACCNNWKQKHNSFLKSFAGPLQLLRTMYWRHLEWRGNFHAPWWGQWYRLSAHWEYWIQQCPHPRWCL